MGHFKEPISEMIWDTKYRYRLQDAIQDQTIEATWARVAKAISKAEKKTDQSFWEQKFLDALNGFQFLPGGRIIAGAGTKHTVTLFNCFVMPLSDSLISIFNSLKEAAITLQEGGGVGYDFSALRPNGFPTAHSGGRASGPVSFMKIWDAMSATMQSTGSRRGAMMGVLRCDHPDIEAFVMAKNDPQALRHFNVSVLVSDAFMQAVQHNDPWPLVFDAQAVKVIQARDLWQRIMRSAYDTAEPGVLFENTINRMNTLYYREWISATNPCGEIPLPTYGACNLGAINLTQFVVNPFLPNASIDWVGIEKTVAIATRFLDNVIDVSRYPLHAQKKEAHHSRRIGLGITGLADLFVMMNIRYGSQASIALSAQIMKKIRYTTWAISIELAKERGAFPYFDQENYLAGEFVKTLEPELQNHIAKYGIRNSHHNTIAPTGTISLLANNVSNGIEPIFSASFERTVRTAEETHLKIPVMDYALRLWREKSSTPLPPAWVDTENLLPEHHLSIQAAVQPYIDNAISKTINIPQAFPFEQLSDVYTKAYELGLKGCTIFRPNPITGCILEKTAQKPDDEVDQCCQG